MGAGLLVKTLVRADVTKYLDFNKIGGSFVYKKGKVHKVPATLQEALATDLMGILEKRKFKNMLEWIQKYDEKNPATHVGTLVGEEERRRKEGGERARARGRRASSGQMLDARREVLKRCRSVERRLVLGLYHHGHLEDHGRAVLLQVRCGRQHCGLHRACARAVSERRVRG